MSGVQYPTGFQVALDPWTTGTFKWLLMKSAYVPAPDSEVFVSTVVANEFTDASYARVTMTTPTKVITLPTLADGFGGSIGYVCDDPTFGVVAGGEVATWLVLMHFVTTDADSQLVAALPTNYTADGLVEGKFSIPTLGALVVSTFCSGALF